MTQEFKRILKRKEAIGLTWDEIALVAGIPVSSWMTGVPTSVPSDDEMEKLAPVLNTTFSYLKYGR